MAIRPFWIYLKYESGKCTSFYAHRLFGFKCFQGRLRARGPPLEHLMPGPWINLPSNLEFFCELSVAEGGYVELHQFDDEGERRGAGVGR